MWPLQQTGAEAASKDKVLRCRIGKILRGKVGGGGGGGRYIMGKSEVCLFFCAALKGHNMQHSGHMGQTFSN